MSVTQINSETWLSDFIIFIRDDLLSNITDPELTNRPSEEKFVLTAYPNRPVRYPIITVRDGGSNLKRLGMRSTQMSGNIKIEVRVWARTEKEKNELTQKVIDRFRTNQFSGAKYSDTVGLHDLEIQSIVNVDESGLEGIKSKVITVGNLIIIGQ